MTDSPCETGRWHCAKCGGTHPDKGDTECPRIGEIIGDEPATSDGHWKCLVCGGFHRDDGHRNCPYNIDRPWPCPGCNCLRCSASRLMANARRFYALEQKAMRQGVKTTCEVSLRNPQQECAHCGLSGHSAAFCSYLDRKGRDLKEHGIWELKKGPAKPLEDMTADELTTLSLQERDLGIPSLVWECPACTERFVTQSRVYCCPLCSTVIYDAFRPRIRPEQAPRPKSSVAGFQEAGPPGSLPSRKPPPGGRPAQPVSGGLCGCGPAFIGSQPIDPGCWDVAVAAGLMKASGVPEEQVRRLFATMIEIVYFERKDPTP